MARVKVDTIIDNTTMEQYTSKRGASVLFITPIDGYKLHDNRLDFEDIERGTVKEGFTTDSVSVPSNYDFEENKNNIYTILESNLEEV